jgi:hypothetical protein
MGNADGTDEASRELTSRAPYQSTAKKLYFPDILPKNANIYIHPLPAGELSMDCARHARLTRR